MSLHPISLFRYAALLMFLLSSTTVHASMNGTIDLYDDWNCQHPSTLNPTISVGLSTCLATTNGYGVVVAAYPPCPSGPATLIFYEDTSCGDQFNIGTSIFANNCFQLAAGIGLFDARALMFACAPAANDPQPSNFATVTVSGVVVATGAAGSGSATSMGSGSVTATSATAPAPTGTGNGNPTGSGSAASTGSGKVTTTSATAPAPTGTGNGNPTGSGSNTSGGNTSMSSTSSGLSTSDIVAIAVGVGVGVLTIIVTICIWLFPDFRHKLRFWLCCGSSEQKHLRQSHPDMAQAHRKQAFPPAPNHFPGSGGQAPYNPVRWS